MTRRSPHLAGLALVLLACGPSRRTPTPPHASTDAGANAAQSVDGGAAETVITLDELAARGPTEAPLMREVLRIAEASRPVELKADRDACFRVAFASSSAVRAWIEDDAKTTRGDAIANATTGLVPSRGPACARKGETLRFVVEGPAIAGRKPSSRAVVWQSP